MIKLIHTADLHLDSPASETVATRRQDLRDTFSEIISTAIAKKVDIMLISGDLFDNESVTGETYKFLVSQFKKAPEILFFISPGNHDYLFSNSVYINASFPENVHIFKSEEITKFDVDKLNLCVYGFGANKAYNSSRLLGSANLELDKSKINILMFHGNLISENSTDKYYPISENEIRQSGMDYVALGHVHAFSHIKNAGITFYAYPGCPEGRGFDELGKKGIIIGELGKSRHGLEFLPVCKRIYDIVKIDISKCESFSDIKELIETKLSGYDSRYILRVMLEGYLDSGILISDLLLNEAKNNCLYIEYENSTRLKLSPSKFSNSMTLSGQFVLKMQEKINAETDEGKREILEKALYYGLSALQKEEVKII